MTVDPKMLRRDVRGSAFFHEAHRLFASIYQPGSGQVADATEIHVSPDGRTAVYAGVVVDDLESAPRTHICQTEIESGQTQVLTPGPQTDRHPKYSPDGRHLAFLSDRSTPGDFQLVLLHIQSGSEMAAPRVDGWIEYLHWSPDGSHILLGVAEHGADSAGAHGAVPSRRDADGLPAWLPAVDVGEDAEGWRRLWIYDVTTRLVMPIGPRNCNVWEATWCGNLAVAGILSSRPSEGAWYDAYVGLLTMGQDAWRDLYRPTDQVGWASASPDGRHLACVEAVCSDRWIVAGELMLIEPASGKRRSVDTNSVDITWVEWRSDHKLLLAGHRGLEMVVATYDLQTDRFIQIWSSVVIGTSGRFAAVSGFGSEGDCLLIGEGFERAPEIGAIWQGCYHKIISFDLGYARASDAIAATEEVRWLAPDGLELQGWLLRPGGEGPHPLVMAIHGGPVLHWRSMWLGRARTLPLLMLLERGYAIFFPNPRGSSGRGRLFARHVVGDMGGADAQDLLAGLDHLVAQGVADPDRLGVTGVSYGGFMTCWLITQDQRFAAAVPVAPITNFVTEQLMSNIPHFVRIFLKGRIDEPGGPYFRSSPISHAHKARTPTLTVCGLLDRCTPPAEAIQFHSVLREHGVTSVLARYPEEGHGIQALPAAIDFAARLVSWVSHFMPAAAFHQNEQA